MRLELGRNCIVDFKNELEEVVQEIVELDNEYAQNKKEVLKEVKDVKDSTILYLSLKKIVDAFETIKEINKKYEEGLQKVTKSLDSLGIEECYVSDSGNHIIFYVRSFKELEEIAKITYQEIKGNYITFLIEDSLKVSFHFKKEVN